MITEYGVRLRNEEHTYSWCQDIEKLFYYLNEPKIDCVLTIREVNDWVYDEPAGDEWEWWLGTAGGNSLGYRILKETYKDFDYRSVRFREVGPWRDHA